MADPPRIGRPVFRLEVQAAPQDGVDGARDGWVFLTQAGQGLVRVGRARKAPRGAARDWKANVMAYARVDDRYAAEALLHRALAAYRVVSTKLYRLTQAQAMVLMREHFAEVVVVPLAEQ